MPRAIRIAVTFAIVLVAFWTYRLLAVPWIEPTAGRWQTDAAIEFGPPPDRLAGLRELFAANDWELDERTKILEVDRVKLLWKDLTELGDGKAELIPYTMIFLPAGSSQSESERLKEAFVVQAPEGALLTFDRPLDLRKGDIGRLLAGQLRGPVTIRSRGKLPGREDDFFLVTRDVNFNEQRLWTPHPLEFTRGRSSGRGTELEAKFLPGEPADAGKKHGMNVSGLQTAKVSHIERLRLDLGSTASLFGNRSVGATVALSPRGGSATATPTTSPSIQSPNAPPRTAESEPSQVEVTCRGPVVYDALVQALVFRDQVDVLQAHPSGPSDQINCEVLAVCFARRRAAAGGKKEPAAKPTANFGGMSDLEAQRIEASGNPVVVRARASSSKAAASACNTICRTARWSWTPLRKPFSAAARKRTRTKSTAPIWNIKSANRGDWAGPWRTGQAGFA